MSIVVIYCMEQAACQRFGLLKIDVLLLYGAYRPRRFTENFYPPPLVKDV